MEIYTIDEWLEKNAVVYNLIKTNQITEEKLRELIEYGEMFLRTAMINKNIKALDILIANQLRFTIPTGEIISKTDDLNSYKDKDRNVEKLNFISQKHFIGI